MSSVVKVSFGTKSGNFHQVTSSANQRRGQRSQIKCCPLIGQEQSHDLNIALWLAEIKSGRIAYPNITTNMLECYWHNKNKAPGHDIKKFLSWCAFLQQVCCTHLQRGYLLCMSTATREGWAMGMGTSSFSISDRRRVFFFHGRRLIPCLHTNIHNVHHTMYVTSNLQLCV